MSSPSDSHSNLNLPPSSTPPKQKKSTAKTSRWGCFLGVSLAILMGGGAAAYWVLKPARQASLTAAENASILPDETVAIAHFNTPKFADLAQFGTPNTQAKIQAKFAAALAAIAPDLNWKTDLDPWIGSVTLAWSAPTPAQAKTDPSPRLYAAIGIRNKLKALQFAQTMQAKTQSVSTETEYQGIKITEIKPTTGMPIALAILKGRLLVAGSVTDIQNVIDDQAAQRTWNQQATTQQYLSQNLGITEPIFSVYVPNYTAAQTLAKGTLSNASGIVNPDQASSLNPNPSDSNKLPAEPQKSTNLEEQINSENQVKAIIAQTGLTDQGLQGRTTIYTNQALALQQLKPVSSLAAKTFPKDTLILLTGTEVSKTWTEFVKQANTETATVSGFSETLKTLRSSFKSLGLDLDQEVISWLDRDFAVGLFPVETGILKQLGSAAAAVIETSNPQTATATVNKLADRLKRKIPFPLKKAERQVQSIAIQEWTVPVPGLGTGGLFGYGWINDNLLLIGLSAPAIDAIAQPQTTLDQDPLFKAVMSNLPAKVPGYFYANFEQLNSRLANIPLQAFSSLPQDSLSLLESLRGVGVSATANQGNQLTIDTSIVVIKHSKTTPQPQN